MWVIGPIGFTTPWLLWALAGLPVLWWLLRAVPPAPVRRRFPGVALLLGLSDDSIESDRTPWWLLALRMAALAALILGFAGPVLNPVVQGGSGGPLLIVMDGSWADARDWPRRQERLDQALDAAARGGRPVSVVLLSDPPPPGPPAFQPAAAWAERVAGLQPRPFEPGAAALAWAEGLEGRFDSLWLSDGLARDSRAAVLAALERHGSLRVFETPRPVFGLAGPVETEGRVTLRLTRAGPGAAGGAAAAEVTVLAVGPDPAGISRELARRELQIPAGSDTAEVVFDLPPEVRNRVQRFELEGGRSAGSVALADDSLRRRKVALISGGAEREGLQLLAPTHYLRQALSPVADLLDGSLSDVLLAGPDVVVLADVARLSVPEEEALQAWLAKGGLLLRFAGPRMAAADEGRDSDSPLLPVRLRAGGRTVGGAMSWGEPRRLAPFPQGSPFFGLPTPEDVTVRAQLLAQPDPELSARTIATLADGTPLVTRSHVGGGQVVLFHITANAEWSSLPLSGLFMQMLERLAVSARGAALPSGADMAGTRWEVVSALDAYGRAGDGSRFAAVEGPRLAAALASGATAADLPPGIYGHEDRRLALNVIAPERRLAPADWPAHVPLEGLETAQERGLKGVLLALALAVLLLDVLATLAVSGQLRWRRRAAVLVLAGLPGLAGLGLGGAATGVVLGWPAPAQAQTQAPTPTNEAFALEATTNLVLGYVVTGASEVDELSAAGLAGLGQALTNRTTIEPAAPMAVDLEEDEIAFFPFLYWPVTATQPMPSAAAYRKLNQYLQTGGMILFDTRDGDVADFGGTSPEAQRLQLLAQPLDIPPLEPIPEDHVLTRTFYLLQDFPGRHQGRSIWVEAAPPDAEQAEGMPFRNLNDGVTPVVIGGNDWAAAWATDARGVPLRMVGRGFAGEHQREMAWRFGINLIMHVLTGNYKSDQVHVPALLERLGQ